MPQGEKTNWKDTLNLPQTAFPMKASLNQNEPSLLEEWDRTDLYRRILAERAGSPRYILHDGPPYANGHIHLGHALNKILKDFIVKSKSMEGFQAPYVPGWDCHGLPIEINIDRQLGEKKQDMSALEIRQRCRAYAEDFVNIQRDEFRRLGVLGDWEHPYRTIDPSYEAHIIRSFGAFVKTGNVVRKNRPVYWCVSCQTALAEAEVEYQNHRSHSITVPFLMQDLPEAFRPWAKDGVSILIWTTTPWTLPANLAIAVHPEYDYALFELNGRHYIAASRLTPLIAEQVGGTARILAEVPGAELHRLKARHPLFERDSLIINTDYVALDTGTGCVHTAPGHGEDDYRAGLSYGLEIYSPVKGDGTFDESAAPYTGLQVFAANDVVCHDLEQKGALLHRATIEHSYPHCWRCKNPVIFRATPQWFIAMDTAQLREQAREAIRTVSWLPPWGEERIDQMIANRPDWCISRQRTWGVPIPVFFCDQCGEGLLSAEAVEKVATTFETEGSDAWYRRPASDFIPEGTVCPQCGQAHFHAGRDILDVWFESGASWGVVEQRENHAFPADMYLEGGDQYRGWFHSSLLVGVRGRGQSPYRGVITHGWALDHEGRAMSKSLGNVIKPQSIIDAKGAEILRLWIAMVNYREDIRLGEEILARVVESYRKIRNTWRFMLGVLHDFNPDTDTVPLEQRQPVDLYALSRHEAVKQQVLDAYRSFEFHQVAHRMFNYFISDLSAFYLNIQKDPLYCQGADDPVRRSAQSTIFTILAETLRLMAPILSFTAEEAWRFLPSFAEKKDSVFLHLLPQSTVLPPLDQDRWNRHMAWRDEVLKALEETRASKTIRDALEAEVFLTVPTTESDDQDDPQALAFLFGVARVRLEQGPSLTVRVAPFDGAKCPRCWNRFTPQPSDQELCPRCAAVMENR